MTFSDPDIRNMLASFFTCAWKNLEGDRRSGGSPRIKPGGAALPTPRGSGFSNVQLVILTPDGRLLHSLSGFINADDLRWELAHALITYEVMLAHPKEQRRAVVRRQGEIQDAFLGAKRRKPKGLFELRKAKSKTRSDAPRPSAGARRHTADDRQVVRRHALTPVGRLTTRQLVNERRGGDFARDGKIIDRPAATGTVASWPASLDIKRPLPWAEMSPALRARMGTALGVTPPEPAEKKKRRRTVR